VSGQLAHSNQGKDNRFYNSTKQGNGKNRLLHEEVRKKKRKQESVDKDSFMKNSITLP